MTLGPVVFLGTSPALASALEHECQVQGIPLRLWPQLDGWWTAGPEARLVLLEVDRTHGRAQTLLAESPVQPVPAMAIMETILPDAVPDLRAAKVRRVLTSQEFMSELAAVLRAVA